MPRVTVPIEIEGAARYTAALRAQRQAEENLALAEAEVEDAKRALKVAVGNQQDARAIAEAVFNQGLVIEEQG